VGWLAPGSWAGSSTHSSQEFSCSLVRRRLMGTHVGGYFFNGLSSREYFLRIPKDSLVCLRISYVRATELEPLLLPGDSKGRLPIA